MAAADRNFVHLHVHSDYSLLDGCCRIDRLMERALELGMSACALTDHGNMYGAIEFYTEAKRKGLKPLIGCELYLTQASRLEKSGRPDEGSTIFHLGLLAKNLTGYQNLLKLVSDAHLRGFYYKPRTDLDTLAKHASGLIGFTGCLASLVPQHLLFNRFEEARQACGRFVEIFGRENFFVELQDHGTTEQRQIIPGLLRLARDFNLAVVCSNDVHYIRAQDVQPHDALLCIQTGAKLRDEKRMRFAGDQFYLKSREEMARIFAEVPDAVTNTLLVAEMCEVAIPFARGTERYPRFLLPPTVSTDRATHLRDLCAQGLRQRYGIDQAAVASRDTLRDAIARCRNSSPGQPVAEPPPAPLALDETIVLRLEYELAVLANTGFVDSILIVADIVRWAEMQTIPVGPGSGTLAGSLVAFCVGISRIDPIRLGISFERFLNPLRIAAPYFRIECCRRRRLEVFDYVRARYGQDCVANVVTFDVFTPQRALREVAGVHGLPYAEGERLAGMIPPAFHASLADGVSAALQREVARNPVAREIVADARVLDGLIRGTGKNADAIIITDRPLDEFAPLTLEDGDITLQFDRHSVSRLGFVQTDIVGQWALTAIAEAVENIRQSVDSTFKIDAIPLEDRKTFALFQAGRTTGVVEFDSADAQAACREVTVSRYEDIQALCALCRPGPIEFVAEFAKGQKNPAQIVFPHPLLAAVLRETHGIVLYQEQVMECAKLAAGYTLAEADILRRTLGKRDPGPMDEERMRFVRGAKRLHGWEGRLAAEVFDALSQRAGYTFSKAYAAGYATVAYQMAYLKANYPAYFLAAVLGTEADHPQRVATLVAEARARRIRVLGPDVNTSNEGWSVVGGNLQVGLVGIREISPDVAAEIVAERTKRGRFTSLGSFARRMKNEILDGRRLEHLAKSGAFDFCGLSRRLLVQDAEAIRAGRRPSSPARSRAAETRRRPGHSVDDYSVNEQRLLEEYLLGFAVSPSH